MSYSVLNLKQDLTGVIHGTTLNKVQNLDGNINRAARQLLEEVDPQETQRITQFATPIFEGVYSYYLAPDVKGNKIIDIRPQVNRTLGDLYNQDYSQQFNFSKTASLENQFNIQWNTGVRTIQVNAPTMNSGVVVNYASAVSGTNGTWSAGGDVTDLTTDNVNWIAGGGSLVFNLSGAGTTGYVENSTMDSVDLSDFLNQSWWFLYTFLPSTPSGFTSINLRFGSSSSDYYSVSATLTQADTAFETGWNQLAFQWDNLTETGTPDPSDITYVRVTWTYDGDARTGVRLNDISCLAGQIMEYVYYSKYLFRDSSTGAFQETVTDDSNLINLDTDSYNLLFNKVAYFVAQQLQGKDAMYDVTYWANEYQKALDRYKMMYKSEVQKPKVPYYTFPTPGYTGFIPRRWA